MMTMSHSKNASAVAAASNSRPSTTTTTTTSNVKKNDDSSPSKQPILAQRFRTKLCNKFATTGSCPYVHRCMFAHGKDELRTAGQNVAAGLVSEEAIRAFKREQYEARTRAAAAKKRAQTTSGAVPAAATRVRSQQHSMPAALPKEAIVGATNTPVACGTSAAALPMAVPSVAALLGGSASAASAAAAAESSDESTAGFVADASAARRSGSSRSARRYRHDPYAEASAWHPLAEAAEEERASVALAAPAMALSVVSSWGASSSASSSQGSSPRHH